MIRFPTTRSSTRTTASRRLRYRRGCAIRARSSRSSCPIFLLVLIAATVGNINFELLIQSIASANPWLLLAAFVVYYLGFPLRG